jgi:hypothetical protein
MPIRSPRFSGFSHDGVALHKQESVILSKQFFSLQIQSFGFDYTIAVKVREPVHIPENEIWY